MKIISIKTVDVANGPGCRLTIWVAGCSHNCPGCHNPESHNYNIGTDLNTMKVWDIVEQELSRPEIEGLTITGGDPLDQSNDSLFDLLQFIIKVRYQFPDKNIWLYTGYNLDEIEKGSLKYIIAHLCDTVVDGPYIEALRDTMLYFRGSSNQRIIDITDDIKTNVQYYSQQSVLDELHKLYK